LNTVLEAQPSRMRDDGPGALSPRFTPDWHH
jgi:hypothetical protein